ncbi:erythromycin esterase family protein [Mucilaginibacter pallidiroseus]|uniref:Erythromycin esterase family protein n=1 Tax=Mucilaginibacter pallidiroseus TaxID=2599295 RepID=A0A563UBW5_9SPHI|nr:erythromycin esterase family protein [Mucilaginibacter pallidiroseus]TWR28816.1 erythromycin esterase family protein [Mucilaginibacter pallidiroseus]
MFKRFLGFVLFLELFVTICFAQQFDVDALNAAIKPVDASGSYLPYLAAQLKGNVICGLGEASHGTHEFYTEKSRIVNYLISKDNYRSIGFEYGYSAIEPINNYLQTGRGNLRQLMKPLRLFRTEEFYRLFQSLKQFNDKQAAGTKVAIFGFDTDYFKRDIDASAKYCINYLLQHQQTYQSGPNAIKVLKKVTALGFNNMFDLPLTEQAILSGLNTEVSSQQSGPVGFAEFKKRLSILYQGTLLTDPLARDKFMAANITETQQAGKRKTIIWGHNVHLAKDTTMAQCKGMGYYLRNKYQSQYFALAFDTYQGGVTVMNGDYYVKYAFQTPQPSFSAWFASASQPNFYLPFSSNGLISGQTGNITNVFANWSIKRVLPMRPGIDFDALMFFRNTTPSQPLR